MRVEIDTPPVFGRRSAIDADGFLTLKDGARVRDVYRKLLIPPALSKIVVCLVNYQNAPLDQVLQEGDSVTFLFPMMVGG